MFFLTNIITDIYIEGNAHIKSEEIINRLGECGLKKGMLKAFVDTDETEKLFKIANSDVSYIAININGTKAYVQIAEARKKPNIEEKDKAYDIVSDYDGVIESIRTKAGFQVVNAGDSVYKGQLLVSGIGDSRFLTVRYINSNADIIIRNWKSYIKEFPLTKTQRFATGEKNTSYEIYIFGKKVKTAKTKFKNFSLKYKKTYKINSILEINKIEYTEEVVQEEKLSLKEAFDYYYPLFLSEAKASLKKDCKIEGVKHNHVQNNDKIRIWIEFETLNSGGVKKEIKKDEIDNGEIN
jgi:similar to stage IV sporulation protein